MPKSQFVDFKAVKAAITMEQVLTHYGLMDKFNRGTDSQRHPPRQSHHAQQPEQAMVNEARKRMAFT